MNKQLVATMSDGTQWSVPAELVANHRAEEKSARSIWGRAVIYDEVFNETYDSDIKLLDWANNHMDWRTVDWSEYEPCLMNADRHIPFQYEGEWAIAPKSVIVM